MDELVTALAGLLDTCNVILGLVVVEDTVVLVEIPRAEVLVRALVVVVVAGFDDTLVVEVLVCVVVVGPLTLTTTLWTKLASLQLKYSALMV